MSDRRDGRARFQPSIGMIVAGLLAMTMIVSSCSFSGIGRDLGDGLSEGLAAQGDSIGAGLGSGLIRSIRDSVLSDVVQDRLASMVDSVLGVAGHSVTGSATGLRDSILGDYTREWILALERDLLSSLDDDVQKLTRGLGENLLGAQTRARVRLLRDELLGPQLHLFAAALRDTLLGDELRRQIGLLRDDLLGERTRLGVDSLLVSAGDRIRQVTRDEESFLTRNITEILWTVGGILALLLILGGFVFNKSRNYRRMLDVLTLEIEKLKGEKVEEYDALTDKIHSAAVQAGVEPKLRAFLEERGMLGESKAE